MKGLWSRPAPPPAEVVALAGAHGGALAWGGTTAGEPVVAARQALLLGAEPVPWHLIDHAAWEPPVLSVRYRDAGSGRTRQVRWELATHGELPPVIRQGVTRTVVTSRRVALEGELGAVLAARRDPAGKVSWTVVFDAGLDPADPGLQARARAELAALRETLGV
jgi:hypothetical protein